MEEIQAEKIVLVAEHNPEHFRLIERVFCESQVHPRLIRISDGREFTKYLQQEVDKTAFPLPNLILLDLSIPGKDGLEILSEIKTHALLKRIPIVILALSTRAEDILSSYQLQGNCYVVKSADLDQLFSIIKRIEEFWLGIVTLPSY